jgi:hypothetical protein
MHEDGAGSSGCGLDQAAVDTLSNCRAGHNSEVTELAEWRRARGK